MEETPGHSVMKRLQRLLAVAGLLAILWLAFDRSGLRAQVDLQFVHDRFEHNKFTGLLVFSGLFVLGNLVQIPGWIFLAAAVLTLGRFWGGWATYLAACLSCVATFVLVRLVGGNALREFGGSLSQRVFARLDGHPVQCVVVLRLVFQTVPALNYALALSGVDFGAYLVGTLIGLPLPIGLYALFFDALAHWFHWPVPAAT
jgi:uncharacterized membrane protein YdjX (TVP38/TMEM64 family)